MQLMLRYMRSKQFVKKLIVQFSENLKLHVYIWTVVWLCDRCVYYTNLRCIFIFLSGIVLNETSVLNIQWHDMNVMGFTGYIPLADFSLSHHFYRKYFQHTQKNTYCIQTLTRHWWIHYTDSHLPTRRCYLHSLTTLMDANGDRTRRTAHNTWCLLVNALCCTNYFMSLYYSKVFNKYCQFTYVCYMNVIRSMLYVCYMKYVIWMLY